MLIPYDTGDIEWNAGLAQCKDLRASGKYSQVLIRKRKPEGGRNFGRVFVERIEPTPTEPTQP